MSVIRKHRFWETFLHKVLGKTLHEIHREAENLEHQTSDFLAEKLSEFLGHPQFDPHGDPIPTAEGNTVSVPGLVRLSQMAPGQRVEIVRLSNSGKDFCEFCVKHGILPGMQIVVENQYPLLKMTEVQVNGTRLLLSEEVAETIFVKILNVNLL